MVTCPTASIAQQQHFRLLLGCPSGSPTLSDRPLDILQPATAMGPMPGQSPHMHLSHGEKVFFALDLGLLGCGPGAEGERPLDVAAGGGGG